MSNAAIWDTHLEACVRAVWLENGLRESSAHAYLLWVRRFAKAHAHSAPPTLHLTRAAVESFARSRATERGTSVDAAVLPARNALKAWAHGLRLLGEAVPDWEEPPPPPSWPPIAEEFALFRRKHAGVAESTVQTDLPHVIAFLEFVNQRRGTLEELRLEDIDEFVTAASTRWRKKTVARLCTALRSFFRFLHLRGQIAHDLAAQIGQPRSIAAERPPRALPWPDVQRLLGAVDRNQRIGRRDYALLLLMATYGMGAAEVLHLKLEDVDWRAGTIQAYRPKTGVSYLLPLVPAVAAALTDYLRDGRPRHATTRRIFVAGVEPHGPMSSSAIRHMVRTHARAAGITAAILGAHVLRHSHACRQVELGASLKAIGDILGHRAPASTSAYTRVATERLREMALPVPQWP